MNPLNWKREHQVAFVIAVVLGGFLGRLYGINNVSLFDHGYHSDTYWNLIWEWTALGAVLGGVPIYIWQLLRH